MWRKWKKQKFEFRLLNWISFLKPKFGYLTKIKTLSGKRPESQYTEKDPQIIASVQAEDNEWHFKWESVSSATINSMDLKSQVCVRSPRIRHGSYGKASKTNVTTWITNTQEASARSTPTAKSQFRWQLRHALQNKHFKSNRTSEQHYRFLVICCCALDKEGNAKKGATANQRQKGNWIAKLN